MEKVKNERKFTKMYGKKCMQIINHKILQRFTNTFTKYWIVLQFLTQIPSIYIAKHLSTNMINYVFW